jgi:hypothetical protein
MIIEVLTGVLRKISSVRRIEVYNCKDEGARLLLAQETVTADQFPAIRSAGPQTKSAA